jgi:gas vesicle protein
MRMQFVFLILLCFSTINLLAKNDSNESIEFQKQIQELKTQNEHLKKDLEVATKNFELLENKITYKSDKLDDLAKQIKINEENFNKTFNLYFWMLFVSFIFLIGFGIYKGYKIWKIKDELDEYKKDTFNPASESIKSAQEILTSSTKTLTTEIMDYKNKISQLYKNVENDKNDLLKPLEEKILSLEDRILKYEKEHSTEENCQSIDASHQIGSNDTQLPQKSANDLLE